MDTPLFLFFICSQQRYHRRRKKQVFLSFDRVRQLKVYKMQIPSPFYTTHSIQAK